MEVHITVNTDTFLAALREQKEAALEAIGLQAEGYAKLLAQVATSNLKNSITHALENENTVCIGTDVVYAKYVEFGHHQTPGRYVPAIGKRLVKDYVAPQPFLKPAVENHVAEYKAIAETYLKG